MPNQIAKTKLMTCFVNKTDPHVIITPTLSHPTSGGWSVFLDTVFKQGGNDPADVDLGTGASVVSKMAEVSATMKNITNATAVMSLKVDAAGDTDTIDAPVPAGQAAHFSMFVAFLEEL